MTDISVLLTILAAWFILNIWVLPRFGMKTCLSGFCNIDSQLKARSQKNNMILESESVQPSKVSDSELPQTGELK